MRDAISADFKRMAAKVCGAEAEALTKLEYHADAQMKLRAAHMLETEALAQEIALEDANKSG